jgi:hypothetical protein
MTPEAARFAEAMDYARAFIDWAAREDDATFAAWSSALMLEPEQAALVQQCVAYTLMRGKVKGADAERLLKIPSEGGSASHLACLWGMDAERAASWLREMRRLGLARCSKVRGAQVWSRA